MTSTIAIEAPSTPWGAVLPEGWKRVPLFAVLLEKQVKNRGGVESNVLSLSYGRIIRRDVESNFGLLPESFETYQIVEPGDLILRLTDLQNDQRSLRVGLVHERGIITSAYLCLTPNAEILPKFAYLLLHAYDLQKVFYSLGGGVRQSLKYEELKWLQIPLPPLSEQRAIVAFLDRETTQLDALLERKQRLLGLLEEQRRAVISQAVTRGLNPDAPLKDSGVPWLGQVPEGWEVGRLKNLSRFVTSGSRGWAEYYADSGSVFMRIGNLQRNAIDPDLRDIQYVNVPVGSEGERTRIQEGDLLISITADLGSVAAASEALENAYVSQHVALVRLQSNVSPRWLGYSILGEGSKSHFKMASYGGTKIQLSLDDVRETPIPIPPFPEQQAIAAFLDSETAKLDALRLKLEQSMERLREYRSALITAAVTGQIDVSGEVN